MSAYTEEISIAHFLLHQKSNLDHLSCMSNNRPGEGRAHNISLRILTL